MSTNPENLTNIGLLCFDMSLLQAIVKKKDEKERK